MNDPWQWFHEIYAQGGPNFSIFYDSFDRARYFSGLRLTVLLAVSAIFISVPLGFFLAWAQTFPNKIIKALANVYVQAFRNTPPLIQLYILFFGIGLLLPRWLGQDESSHAMLSATQWAIIAISLNKAAFNAEVFRSGIEAVPADLLEASESMGLSRRQGFFWVVMPLALRISLPALTNNLVDLVKNRSEEHTSELQSLMRISYAVFCLKKNKTTK